MLSRQIRLNGPLIYASARSACKSHRRGLEAVSRLIVPWGSVPGRFSGTREEVAVKRHSPSLFRLSLSLSLFFPYFSMAKKQGTAFRDINIADKRLYNLWVFPRWTKGSGWEEREREGGRKFFLVCISCEYRSKQCRGPKLPSFRLYSRLVSQGKRNEREREKACSCLLPRTISSSAVLPPVFFLDLCRGEIFFSPFVRRSLRNWPNIYHEYLVRLLRCWELLRRTIYFDIVHIFSKPILRLKFLPKRVSWSTFYFISFKKKSLICERVIFVVTTSNY